ncbi:MAG: hypothetical protein ABI337_08880 [Nitrososphaera sp.]|jgi:uncharacterized protein YwbE
MSLLILSFNTSTTSNIPKKKTTKAYGDAEIELIVKSFKNKYKTAKITQDEQKTILRAETPHGISISLTIQTLSDGTTSVIIACDHNDWRGLEIITENVLDYLTNENCFNPSLEELQETNP